MKVLEYQYVSLVAILCLIVDDKICSLTANMHVKKSFHVSWLDLPDRT